LPDLGEGITEAELRRWLVKEGDTVAEHQPVVEVETDKAVVEVPSPRAGRVITRARLEGETVMVGETLLTIAEEEATPPVRKPSVGIVGELPEAEEAVGTQQPAILATPLVRKLARERGIDLATVRGSGPRGSITPEDVAGAGAPA
ncbi:MAG TPA: 2-oxo acid dehydrogenase subunit E2, partial [Geobacter sulfurreducens]|nr:2-oxo acid dehydrogenase subunit E2 [Geobacter sulfurreducens]